MEDPGTERLRARLLLARSVRRQIDDYRQLGFAAIVESPDETEMIVLGGWLLNDRHDVDQSVHAVFIDRTLPSGEQLATVLFYGRISLHFEVSLDRPDETEQAVIRNLDDTVHEDIERRLVVERAVFEPGASHRAAAHVLRYPWIYGL